MNAEALESYLIPEVATEGIFQKMFGKKSRYDSMSNKELAQIMYERLSQNSTLKLGKANDPAVDNQFGFNKSLTSQFDGENAYEEYDFGGVPVLVIKNGIGKNKGWDNPSFNIWAYVNGGNKPQLISTSKKALIQSFIKEDKGSPA